MSALRVGFAGTPAFATRALQAIAAAGFTIPLCLTQPDRPKGRGLKLERSPVRALAEALRIEVFQPRSLRSPEDRAPFVEVPLDVLVVAAYGLILPQPLLDWPRHGCLNIHASRLPRWRGAAPIARAIEAGDRETGISIMRMDAGLDTGPIVGTVDVPIALRDTAATLHDRLAEVGAHAIVATLGRLAHDQALHATPQSAQGATYAAKIGRRDAAIEWTLGAVALDRRVRAFDPVPGATASYAGETVKIHRALPIGRSGAATPGEVIARTSEGIDVACGAHPAEGALRLVEVQPAGGRRMTADAYAAGRGIGPGARFGAGAPVAR
ncbi:MAG: methionyl-tRNA formyltransferase [Betaproteobacteria bacterium]